VITQFKIGLISLLLTTTLFISACSSVKVDLYSDNAPELKLNEYFNGELTAHGIIKNRSGEVIRYFNVSMTGDWDSNGVGTLDEVFTFDDGEIQNRIWTFTPEQDGHYSASANDTVAPVETRVSGNAFFMEYVLKIIYKDWPLEVSIDDRMYLINDSVMINESTMKKFGIEVGYITLTILKQTSG